MQILMYNNSSLYAHNNALMMRLGRSDGGGRCNQKGEKMQKKWIQPVERVVVEKVDERVRCLSFI